MPWSERDARAILHAVKSQAAKKSVPSTRSTSFDPDVAIAFGAVFKALRLKTEHAQDTFSLIAGVDRSYYGKLERGERQPTVALLLRIAKALGVSGAEVMADAEKLIAKNARQRARRR